MSQEWLWEFADGRVGIGLSEYVEPLGGWYPHRCVVRTEDGEWHWPPLELSVGEVARTAPAEAVEEFLRFLEGTRTETVEIAVKGYVEVLREREVNQCDGNAFVRAVTGAQSVEAVDHRMRRACAAVRELLEVLKAEPEYYEDRCWEDRDRPDYDGTVRHLEEAASRLIGCVEILAQDFYY